MKAEKVAVIADNAGELASLEAIGALHVKTWLDLLYQRLSDRQIILPVMLGEYCRENPESGPDVMLNHVLLKTGHPPAIGVDEPTRVYFAVFHSVFHALWAFVPIPEPVVLEAVPAPKPGGKGYNKPFQKSGKPQRGFKK